MWHQSKPCYSLKLWNPLCPVQCLQMQNLRQMHYLMNSRMNQDQSLEPWKEEGRYVVVHPVTERQSLGFFQPADISKSNSARIMYGHVLKKGCNHAIYIKFISIRTF